MNFAAGAAKLDDRVKLIQNFKFCFEVGAPVPAKNPFITAAAVVGAFKVINQIRCGDVKINKAVRKITSTAVDNGIRKRR